MNRDELWPVVAVVLGASILAGVTSATLTEVGGLSESYAAAVTAGWLAIAVGAVLVLSDAFDSEAYRSAGRGWIIRDGILLFVVGLGASLIVSFLLVIAGFDGVRIGAGPVLIGISEILIWSVGLLSALSLWVSRNQQYMRGASSVSENLL